MKVPVMDSRFPQGGGKGRSNRAGTKGATSVQLRHRAEEGGR